MYDRQYQEWEWFEPLEPYRSHLKKWDIFVELKRSRRNLGPATNEIRWRKGLHLDPRATTMPGWYVGLDVVLWMSYEMSCCFWGKRIRQQKPIHFFFLKKIWFWYDQLNSHTYFYLILLECSFKGVVRWCLAFSRNPAIATHSAKAVLWYSLKLHQIRKVGEGRYDVFLMGRLADEDDRPSLWC